MDLDKIIAELRAERDRIEEAILAIERIAQTTGNRRRGRRPKWLIAAEKGTSGGVSRDGTDAARSGRKAEAAPPS